MFTQVVNRELSTRQLTGLRARTKNIVAIPEGLMPPYGVGGPNQIWTNFQNESVLIYPIGNGAMFLRCRWTNTKLDPHDVDAYLHELEWVARGNRVPKYAIAGLIVAVAIATFVTHSPQMQISAAILGMFLGGACAFIRPSPKAQRTE